MKHIIKTIVATFTILIAYVVLFIMWLIIVSHHAEARSIQSTYYTDVPAVTTVVPLEDVAWKCYDYGIYTESIAISVEGNATRFPYAILANEELEDVCQAAYDTLFPYDIKTNTRIRKLVK